MKVGPWALVPGREESKLPTRSRGTDPDAWKQQMTPPHVVQGQEIRLWG